MLSVDSTNFDETLRAVRHARGQLALRALRRQARASGADRLSPADIDAEIAAARKARV